MSYTLVDIRNQVLNDKLDDTSFDPDVVDRFINATQRDIFNTYELPYTEKVFSGTLQPAERIFAMPTDLQLILSAVITAPDGKQKNITNDYLKFRDFNTHFPTPANNQASDIRYWTSFAGRIYTSAPLDQQYVLDTFYIKKPTELTDDADVPELPEEFQEALVLGAYIRVLQRNEDFDLAAAVKNDYNDQLDKLVGRYGNRVGITMVMSQPRVSPTRRR